VLPPDRAAARGTRGAPFRVFGEAPILSKIGASTARQRDALHSKGERWQWQSDSDQLPHAVKWVRRRRFRRGEMNDVTLIVPDDLMLLRIALERADRHVEEGASLIARQIELVAELKGLGVDVGRYLVMLANFQEAQRIRVERRDRLQRDVEGRLARRG
jgi:hypothetical protein